jgi:hypothetical protein
MASPVAQLEFQEGDRTPFSVPGWLVFGLLVVVALAANAPVLGADCNGNGISDETDIADGTVADCNQNGVADACELGSIQFGRRPSFAVGESPTAIVARDLNGDGYDDLATADEGSVSVLLGNEDGSLEVSSLAVADDGPVGVAAADLNADGHLDLIRLDTAMVRAFLGDGTGRFVAGGTRPASTTVSGLATADLNGDGREDVVVTDRRRDAALVFLSAEDGQLGPELEVAAGDSARAPALRDFDGDGHLDIATVNRRSKDISLLWGVGDGTFAPGVSLPLGDASPDRLAAGDLNGDERPDLVAAHPDAALVLLYQGDRRFGEAVPFAVEGPSSTSKALSLSDLDSDGDLDIIVASGEPVGLAVIVNRGDGIFEAAVTFEVRPLPPCFASGDLDGDGDLDLAHAAPSTDSVGVLWNGNAGLLAMEPRRFLTPIGLVGREESPHGLTVADIDGDDDVDVITVGGSSQGSIQVFSNDGTGDFTVVRLGFPLAAQMDFATTVDVDNDGDTDLIGIGSQDCCVKIFENDGSGGLTLQPLIGAGPLGLSSITANDLNGDGLVDLVATVDDSSSFSVILNRGGGVWEVNDLMAGSRPTAVAVGDFDSDGDQDVAVVSELSAELMVFAGSGDGSFSEPVVYTVPEPRFVATADFDGDGALDLVSASEQAASMALLSGRGDGRFEPASIFDRGRAHNHVITVDLDGDGLVDVVGADERGAVVDVYLNRGAGTFESPIQVSTGRGNRYVAAGDFNGDGVVDLAANNRCDRSITVLLNQTSANEGAPFLHGICTEAEFFELSLPSARGPSVERATQYIVPLDRANPELLEPLFQNASQFPRAREFLIAEFPKRFEALTEETFERLFHRRESRQYYRGDLFRLRTPSGLAYGFSVEIGADDGAPLLGEVQAVHATLTDGVQLAPLLYYPATVAAREAAASWVDPPFDVLVEEPTLVPPDGPEGHPTFVLQIPPQTEVCGGYLGRQDIGIAVTVEEWRRLKTTASFRSGEVLLPTTSETFEGELFDEVVLGPDREVASPEGPGRFRVRRLPDGEATTYRFDFSQSFRLGDESYELRLFNLTFEGRGDEALSGPLVFDEEFLTRRLALEGFRGQTVGYTSCTAEQLPLWEIQAELSDGASLRFLERYEVPPPGETGPASLLLAELELGGVRQVVEGYWELIYAARRHNTFIRYSARLDPPLAVAGLERPVRFVELDHPQEEPEPVVASVSYLDDELRVLAAPGVLSFARTSLTVASDFRRGDVNVDGRRNLVDAIRLLDYLFRHGAVPECRKAADANDDGRINVVDVIQLVSAVVGRRVLPEPFGECGRDPTVDELSCQQVAPCDAVAPQ